LKEVPEGVSFRTALQREGYTAKLGPLAVDAAGGYVFKLQYVLAKGGLAFGAMSADESLWLQRASIPVSQPGERTAVLSLDIEAGRKFWLMIANDHPLGDHASEFTILNLQAWRLPPGESGTSPWSLSAAFITCGRRSFRVGFSAQMNMSLWPRPFASANSIFTNTSSTCRARP
jgi:hypothetical protein